MFGLFLLLELSAFSGAIVRYQLFYSIVSLYDFLFLGFLFIFVVFKFISPV